MGKDQRIFLGFQRGSIEGPEITAQFKHQALRAEERQISSMIGLKCDEEKTGGEGEIRTLGPVTRTPP